MHLYHPLYSIVLVVPYLIFYIYIFPLRLRSVVGNRCEGATLPPLRQSHHQRSRQRQEHMLFVAAELYADE